MGDGRKFSHGQDWKSFCWRFGGWTGRTGENFFHGRVSSLAGRMIARGTLPASNARSRDREISRCRIGVALSSTLRNIIL